MSVPSSSNLSQKNKAVKKLAEDETKPLKSAMQIASLMSALVLQYPGLKDLSREERNIVFKQARPKLSPELKSKRDSLLKLMLSERMRNSTSER